MTTRLLTIGLALVLAATACGGSDHSSEGVATLEAADTATTDATGTTDPAGAVDQEQAMLAFAACMRDNGVDMQDPTVDADGNVQFGGFGGGPQSSDADRQSIGTAMDACRDLLDGLSLGRGGGNFDPTQLQDTMLEYAACMRDNGYDMPDPDFTSFGPGQGDGEPGQGGGGPFANIDPQDPNFIKAQEACQDILSGFGPGGGPGFAGGGPGGDGGGAPPAGNG
ncbi:MAG: hypothetical protein WBV06_12335 [Acidimicrobiia bacterium]